MVSRVRLASLLLTSASLLVGLAQPAAAQCAPDGLDAGPCCLPAAPVLPAFPAMQGQSVRFVSFNNCTTAANALLCANLSAPAPKQVGGALVCGLYDIKVRVRACGVNLGLWSGSLEATYSRNWQHTSTAGTNNLTVWRFLVNGDLVPTSNLPLNPAFRPACFAAFQRVYFSGYIDYAFDCNTNQWQMSWMLDHECDGVHHTAVSARPAPAAGFHPTRSFNFIGPGNTFAVSNVNLPVSNGQISQEAVRRIDWSALPTVCNFEEPAQGNFVALNDFCMCGAAGATQYNAAQLFANGFCGTQVTPSPLSPLTQKRLGRWTSATTYPGLQALLFDFGYLDYRDGCTGTFTTEWFEGPETLGGFPAVQFSGVLLGKQFEDLGSCNKSPGSSATLIGAPHVTDYLLNFNMP